MIKFHCAHCDQKIGVPDEHAGKRIKCPNCGAIVPIPMPEPALDQLAEAALQAEAGAGAPALQAPPTSAARPGPPAAGRRAAEAEPSVPPPQPAPPGELQLPFPARQLDRALDGLRGEFGCAAFSVITRAAFFAAVYGMLLLCMLLIMLAIAARGDSPADRQPVGALLVLAGVLLVGQYFIAKIYRAAAAVAGSSPSASVPPAGRQAIASGSLPDCVSLAALAGALGAIAFAVYAAVASGDWGVGPFAVVEGAVASMACFAVGCGLLNPPALNVSVRAGLSAGQEAIGLLSLLLKLILRVGPLVILCAVFWAAFLTGRAFVVAVTGRSAADAAEQAGGAGGLVIFLAALYAAAYLIFLVYHWIVDVSQAVLEVARNTRHKP